jgi:hypothetical protein
MGRNRTLTWMAIKFIKKSCNRPKENENATFSVVINLTAFIPDSRVLFIVDPSTAVVTYVQ